MSRSFKSFLDEGVYIIDQKNNVSSTFTKGWENEPDPKYDYFIPKFSLLKKQSPSSSHDSFNEWVEILSPLAKECYVAFENGLRGTVKDGDTRNYSIKSKDNTITAHLFLFDYGIKIYNINNDKSWREQHIQGKSYFNEEKKQYARILHDSIRYIILSQADFEALYESLSEKERETKLNDKKRYKPPSDFEQKRSDKYGFYSILPSKLCDYFVNQYYKEEPKEDPLKSPTHTPEPPKEDSPEIPVTTPEPPEENPLKPPTHTSLSFKNSSNPPAKTLIKAVVGGSFVIVLISVGYVFMKRKQKTSLPFKRERRPTNLPSR
ncbi:MAG: hypothetical protein AAF335_05070 [Bacteroidota bacterium]